MFTGPLLSAPDRPRFGELSKLLPVFVVGITIFFLYSEYVILHGFRLLQLDLPPSSRSESLSARGAQELIYFHIVTFLLLYCFARCVLTHPGTIPDGQGWELQADADDTAEATRDMGLIETKHSGERRHCKWCLKYKPDRCHHCRVCNMCILRMDHHCPWVYNCIGFRNHKYFFLILIYAALDLAIICVNMFDTVWWSTRTDVSFSLMLLLVSGEAFATFLMVITVTFLGFHVWLLAKAMTTVEFCEKSLKKASYNSSIYSQGMYKNICAVLGPSPFLWFFPVSLPKGDGVSWPSFGSPVEEVVSNRPPTATISAQPRSGSSAGGSRAGDGGGAASAAMDSGRLSRRGNDAAENAGN